MGGAADISRLIRLISFLEYGKYNRGFDSGQVPRTKDGRWSFLDGYLRRREKKMLRIIDQAGEWNPMEFHKIYLSVAKFIRKHLAQLKPREVHAASDNDGLKLSPTSPTMS